MVWLKVTVVFIRKIIEKKDCWLDSRWEWIFSCHVAKFYTWHVAFLISKKGYYDEQLFI